MTQLCFKIEKNDVKESNRFLRALWAEFRARFGKIGWHYAPYKDGTRNLISFGSFSAGIYTFDVSMKYKKKGCLATLIFEERANAEIKEMLNLAIRAAELRQSVKFFLSTEIYCPYGPFYPYKSTTLILNPLSDRSFALIIQVDAYDLEDAKTETNKFLAPILDMISVGTNCALWSGASPESKDLVTQSEANVFNDSIDWIDDIGRVNGYVALTKPIFSLIESMVSGKESKNLGLFIRASHHFHTARQFSTGYSPVDTRFMVSRTFCGKSLSELSAVLCISALEVASLIDEPEAKNCKACNQVIYKIKDRTSELARKYANESVKRIISRFYDTRSKYLHTGILLGDRSYSGVSSPQLDPNCQSGCISQISVPDLNLIEFTSFVLRQLSLSISSD